MCNSKRSMRGATTILCKSAESTLLKNPPVSLETSSLVPISQPKPEMMLITSNSSESLPAQHSILLEKFFVFDFIPFCAQTVLLIVFLLDIGFVGVPFALPSPEVVVSHNFDMIQPFYPFVAPFARYYQLN